MSGSRRLTNSRFLHPQYWRSLGLNRTVFALALARMADGIGNSILFIVIPLYVLKVHVRIFDLPDPILIGILLSIYGFSNAIAQPVVAILSDRIGHYKRFIQAGLLVLAAATFSFVFAGRYLDLMFLRLAQGFGLALEIPPTLAILTMVTQKESRGGAMGFYTSARMLGLAGGPLIGGMLYEKFGFNSTFFAGAGLLILAMIVVQIGVRDVSHTAAQPERDENSGTKTSLFSPGILSAAFASLLMASAFTLVATLENQFKSRLHIHAFLFAVAFSSLMFSRLICQVPFGRLSDRIGRKPLLLTGLLLLAPTTALLGDVGTFWEFVVVRCSGDCLGRNCGFSACLRWRPGRIARDWKIRAPGQHYHHWLRVRHRDRPTFSWFSRSYVFPVTVLGGRRLVFARRHCRILLHVGNRSAHRLSYGQPTAVQS